MINKKIIFALSFLVIFLVAQVLASTPQQINYQGILREEGSPVNGERDFVFKITNKDGSIEYYSSPRKTLTVENGIFHSTITPTGVNWENIEPYIEVNVGKKGELLEALEPREKIISSVYALNADKIDGIDSEYMVPPGFIGMWSGPVNEIPEGWALCDGTNGTPDLSGRFVVGYDSGDTDYDTVGNTGGEKMHTLTVSEMPSHTHDMKIYNFKQGTNDTYNLDYVGNSDSNKPTENTGGDQPHENRPPYYVLCFIMKL
ncbi:MAG: phage baseplate protein [Atribacterota bacterium]